MQHVLQVGSKVHMVTRRLFEQDVRRHFVGEVKAVDGSIARLEGYAFVYNHATAGYERKPELRNRLLTLTDAGVLINLIPDDVEIDAVHYAVLDGNLVATDGGSYRLDINEFGTRS